LVAILAVANASFLPQEDEVMFTFLKFIKKFDKEYSTVEEFESRFQTFKTNLIMKGDLEITEFLDQTPVEFSRRLNLDASLYAKFRSTMKSFQIDESHVAEEALDWRSKGWTSAVKDQGQCGSCWAFSAVGNIEGIYYVKTKTLENLSEQQLVDCDTEEDQGCNGGFMNSAFKYLSETAGLERTADYKYTAKDGKCKYDAKKAVVKVKSFEDINSNEEQIKQALSSHGPLAVAVDASTWQFYSGGILTAKKCNFRQLNHGVTLVGYGEEKGVKFWIVRNSWGGRWGEQGHLRIERGTGACGINTAVSTAILG